MSVTFSEIRIACIVEGQGEEQAVPSLIHKIARERELPSPVIPKPIRCKRDQLHREHRFENSVRFAASAAGASGAILILLDADDDCPATVGPELLRRATAAARNVPVSMSLASREFESWFISAAESFRGFRGLPENLTVPFDAEKIRGAKEWLRRNMTGSSSYRPTVDQLHFTRQMDLVLARKSASFARFEREVVRLIRKLTANGQAQAP